jgi:predicted DNA binding CopG/RHH family protein
MNKNIKYTNAPSDVEQSLKRAVVIPNFVPTPEQVSKMEAQRQKKQISIFLTTATIEKFKLAAKKNGNRYQTMISGVLDTYSRNYL